MMDEVQLLRMAAKAAGLYVKYECSDQDDNFTGLKVKPSKDASRQTIMHWNPLEDDGDALRLAVKLEMSLGFVLETGGMAHWGPVTYTQARQQIDDLQMGRKRGNSGPSETHGDDPYAATRRAIVRAAAEIGKTIP